MAALAARHVEQARARRKTKELDQPRRFAAVAVRGKDRLVLEQVLCIEVALPPLDRLRTPGHLMKISVTPHPLNTGARMSADGSISRRDAVKVGLGAGIALTLGRSSAFGAEAPWQTGTLIERAIPSSGEKLPVVGIGTAVIYQN